MTQDVQLDNNRLPRFACVVMGLYKGAVLYTVLIDDQAVATRHVDRLNAYTRTRPYVPDNPADLTPSKANDLALWEAAHPAGKRAAVCTDFVFKMAAWLNPESVDMPK